MGQSARAQAALSAALDLARQTGNDYEQARALAGLADLDEPDAAPAYAAQAQALFRRLGVAEAHQPPAAETPSLHLRPAG